VDCFEDDPAPAAIACPVFPAGSAILLKLLRDARRSVAEAEMDQPAVTAGLQKRALLTIIGLNKEGKVLD
jgi:hypothetical protein